MRAQIQWTLVAVTGAALSLMATAGCSSSTDAPGAPDATVPPDAVLEQDAQTGDAAVPPDTGAACTGDEDCNDGVACTEGTCVDGTCQFEARDDLCDDDNDCTTGACDAALGCVYDDMPDDTACTDGGGNAGLCGEGTCLVACSVDGDCNDGNECTTSSCDDNLCVHTAGPEGEPCEDGYCSAAGQCVECLDVGHCPDDGNPCSVASCVAGSCQADLQHDLCDDTNECTEDVCTVDGCTHPPVEDGTSCGAGGTSTCEEGVCVGCTLDEHCDDDVACTVDECMGNVCSNTPDDGACDDDNDCTTNTCTSSGCDDTDVAEGVDCPDGVCDGAGTCVACTNPTHCEDDDNECTVPTCTGNACGFDDAPDGTPCTPPEGGGGDCMAGTCQAAGKDVFRVSTVSLEDPNVHAQVCFQGICSCQNGTTLLNGMLQTSIDELDLNLVFTFAPLDMTDLATTPMELWAAECTSATSCTAPEGQEPLVSTSTFHTSGTCLEPQEGTVHFGNPNTVEAPCWVTDPTSLVFDFDGVLIPLHDAQVAGQMADADTIVDGLILGFLDQDTADEILLPDDLPLIGGEPLSSVLPPLSCNGTEARNEHNGELGWWFHLNFTADRVTDHSGF
jgi:hypothetical protein